MPRAPTLKIRTGDYVFANLPTGVPIGRVVSVSRTHVVLTVTRSDDPECPYPVPYGFRYGERITVPRRRLLPIATETYAAALLSLSR